MRRLLLASLSLLVSLSIRAAEEPAPPATPLEGHVEGNVYVSPTGMFKVTIPVLPELGGGITDTPNVVTFEDDFNVHVSIAAFPHDATQRWELTTRGIKDYLVYFFGNFVLADFRQSFAGVQTESAKFMPGILDGALIAYIIIPRGTMFANKMPHIGFNPQPPEAKRGNLVFVRNGHTFVISIELAEHAMLGKAFNKTKEEEDEILRERLIDIVTKMQFAKPPAPVTPPAPAPVAPAADTKK
jgi:hypothetical protein